MGVGQHRQQSLSDRLAHGGAEQRRTGPDMRGERVGHRDTAEITGELAQAVGGGRHLLDIGEQEAKAQLATGEINAFYQAAKVKFDADPAFADDTEDIDIPDFLK